MNKPAFSRPPLLIGIGGTTRPGSSTERALAAALSAHTGRSPQTPHMSPGDDGHLPYRLRAWRTASGVVDRRDAASWEVASG